jgi:FMN-dependent oxidoreductase (nitrilotriacetate monooxygenase family)
VVTGLHLNLSMLTPGHFRTAWRLPHVSPRAYLDVEHFLRLARIAEAATIDAVFLGDGPALGGGIGRAPDTGLDPSILLTAVATATTHLGVIATSSSTYNSPYNVARRFNALDHVSGGRAAVNVVTTGNGSAAANFGSAPHPDKVTRYRRAAEFLDVVTRLWDAWEPGAVVADKTTGVFARREAIHAIDHVGEFFSVKGPLPVPAGPSGRPLIVQAGGSEGGVALAAMYADLVFTAAQTLDGAVHARRELRGRVASAGRDPDGVKTSLGVVVLVADSDEEALCRERELRATMPIDELTTALTAQLGLPPDSFGPDTPITAADLPALEPDAVFSTGLGTSTRAMIEQRPRTARELVYASAGGAGHRLVVGSAERVADDLERWFGAGAADGFTVMPADTAVDFENFATLVVPILKRRGLFHDDYPAGTLRSRYGVGRVPAGA